MYTDLTDIFRVAKFLENECFSKPYEANINYTEDIFKNLAAYKLKDVSSITDSIIVINPHVHTMTAHLSWP